MPVPSDPARADSISVVVALLHQLHGELRSEVETCSDDALNWVPCPGANSIATIITHILGSEAEALRAVAAEELTRDRDAEFQMGYQNTTSLTLQIDRAEALLDILAPKLSAERALALVSLPTLPSDEARFGITWLVGNVAHAREHMGHLRLTAQLYSFHIGGQS